MPFTKITEQAPPFVVPSAANPSVQTIMSAWGSLPMASSAADFLTAGASSLLVMVGNVVWMDILEVSTQDGHGWASLCFAIRCSGRLLIVVCV